MTTAHMLHMLIHEWHHIAHHGWHFPRRWHLAMRYLWRISHASRGYRASLLHFCERHRYGPRTWRGWNQA